MSLSKKPPEKPHPTSSKASRWVPAASHPQPRLALAPRRKRLAERGPSGSSNWAAEATSFCASSTNLRGQSIYLLRWMNSSLSYL